MPVLAWRFYFVDVHPTLTDRVRLKQRIAQVRSRQSQDVLRTPSARRARRSIRSGYAFAHQEGFGRLITSGKIMRKLPNPEFNIPSIINKLNMNHGSSGSGGGGNSTGGGGESNNKGGGGGSGSSGGGSHHHHHQKGSDGGGVQPDGNQRAPIQDLDTINL
ncbi:unnamed protein product [Callosobruchus maculatus]|uniref:Uncharacterized protein n=1 Tax=Callosobruchus maculatus TaxID=64391 RepID=A0A653D9V1_CALMS|nr:unnamed protein product [Callosobruchus maculatus]